MKVKTNTKAGEGVFRMLGVAAANNSEHYK